MKVVGHPSCLELVLMAVWSKALPQTAGCLSPLPGFASRPRHLRMLPVTWGWAVFFVGYSGFHH